MVSGHWFIYHTLVSFWPPFLPMTPVGLEYLRGALFLLSISFIIAAVLGYRYSNIFVSLTYKIAAVWLGILNFLFWAACLCWIAAFLLDLAAPRAAVTARPWIGTVLFGTALLVSLYGFINARRIRVRRTPVSPAQSASRLAGSHRAAGHRPSPGKRQPERVFAPHRGYRAATQPLHHLPRR